MVLKRSWVLLLLVIATGPNAHAAGATSPIIFNDRDGITATLVPAPNVMGSGSGGGAGDNTPTQWLKVELHFAVVPQTTTPYVDAAEFKIWIEGRDLYAANAPGKDGVAIALTGSVTYINLVKARDCYGVFYVHPTTLVRYSTRNGVDDFNRLFNIHVEANVGGALSDYFDKMKDKSGPDWYKSLTPVAGLVYRQDQSPFLLTDVVRYPAIKLAAPAP